MECILFVTFTAATILILLPSNHANRNPVQKIIFRGLPSAFHAFVLSIMFAFSAAFAATLLIHKLPQIAKLCRCCSLASMASAFAILFWAISNSWPDIVNGTACSG